MKKDTFQILVLIGLFFSACKPMYVVNRSFIGIDASKPKYEKPMNVEIYFTGEPTNFEYEKLGIVEVKATNNVDKSHLFSHLKYEAWNQGADAIISVAKEEKSNVYTTYSSSTKRNTTHVVNTPYLQGIAVKKIQKNETIKEYGFGFEKVDTSFISVVKEDAKIQQKSIKSNTRGWLAYLGIMLVLLFAPIFIVFFIILPKYKSS